MLKFIISCLYFFLPAYVTNMIPPLAKKAGVLNSLDKPVDRNRKFNGKPVLGAHKTWRGIAAGVSAGVVTAYYQAVLYQLPFFKGISLVDYHDIDVFGFSLLMCGGAVLGDLFFAFVKRRLKLRPGAKFVPFDQINYVIGVFAVFHFTSYKISGGVWLTILVLTFFLHIVVNRIGYHLNLHKAKW